MVFVALLTLIAAITIGILVSSTATSTSLANATTTQTQVNTAANTLQRDLSMATSITLAEQHRLEFTSRADGQDLQGAVFGYIPGQTTDVPAYTKTADLPNYSAVIYVRALPNGTVSQQVLVTGWDRDGYNGKPLFQYFDQANTQMVDTTTAEQRAKIVRVAFYIAAFAEGRSSQVQIESSVTPNRLLGDGRSQNGTYDEFNPPAAPTCPANFTANTNQTTRTTTLSWGAPEGATGYVVYMLDGYNGNTINTMAVNIPTTTTLTVPNLVNGMSYDFRLQANGPGGVTGPCTDVRVTIIPNTPNFVNINSLAGLTDTASANPTDVRTSPVREGIAAYSRVTTNVSPGFRYTVARNLTNLLTWDSIPGASTYTVYRVGTATPIGTVSGDSNFYATPRAYSFQDVDRDYGDSTRYYVVASNNAGSSGASTQVTLISPPRATQFTVDRPDTSTRSTTTDAIFNISAQFATTVGHTVMRQATTAADADCDAVRPAGYMNSTGNQLVDPQAPWGSASCYRFVPFNDAGNGESTALEVDQKPGKFTTASFKTTQSMVWIDTRSSLLPSFADCWTTQGRANYWNTAAVESPRASCFNGYLDGPNDPDRVAGRYATPNDKFAIGLFGKPQQDVTNLQLEWTKSENAGGGYDAIRERVRTRGVADQGTAGKVTFASNYNPASARQAQNFKNEMPGSEYAAEVIAKALNGETRSSREGSGGQFARLISAPDIASYLGNEWYTKGSYPYLKVRMHLDRSPRRGYASDVTVRGEAWYGSEGSAPAFPSVQQSLSSTDASSRAWVDGPAYGGNASDRREHRETGWQTLRMTDGNGQAWTLRSAGIGVKGATRGCVLGACGASFQAIPESFPTYLPGGYYRYNSGGNGLATENGGTVGNSAPFTGGDVMVGDGDTLFCENYSESDPLFLGTYGCNYGEGIPPQVEGLVNVKTVGPTSTISWTSMVNAFNGYVVKVVEEGGEVNEYSVAANTTTLQLPVNGTMRTISVSAKNKITTGPESNPITILPLEAPAFATGRSINNSLEARASAVGGATAYTVHYRVNGGTEQKSTNTKVVGGEVIATIPNAVGAVTNVWFTAQNDGGRTTSLAGENTNFNGIAAPANVRYTVTGNQAIITWDAVPLADYYLIYQDGNITVPASGTRVNGVSTTVTVPTNGTTSNIQVRAYRAEDKGETYSAASTLLKASGLSNVSGINSVTADNRTTVTWDATVNATSYDLLYRIAGGTQQTVSIPATNRVFELAVNPAGGQRIEVQVRPRKAEGVGSLSPLFAYNTLGKPAIADYNLKGNRLEVTLAATPGSPTEATLFYQVGAGAVQSTPITTTGGAVDISGITTSDVKYWVQAKEVRENVNTTSVVSDTSTVRGIGVLSGVTSSVSGLTGNVSWTAHPLATAYEVLYRETGTTDAWTVVNTTTTSAQFDLPARSTDVIVRGIADGGKITGLNSPTRTLLAPVVEAPANLTVNATGGAATIAWSAVTHATSYDVTYQVGTATPVTANVTTTSRAITVPVNGSLVKVSVVGKNRLMTGAASTAEFTPLGTPAVENYTIVDDILQIKPKNVTGDVNDINVFYKLNGGTQVVRQVPPAGGALTIPGLSGASAEFWLQSTGGQNNVTLRSVEGAHVIEPSVATPTNLRVVSIDGARVTLAWDGVANADSYRIYQDTNPATYTNGGTVNGTTITVDVPVDGTASSIAVRAVRSTAVTGGVTGIQYSKASATIQAKGIGLVSGLSASSVSGTLNLSWAATPNATAYQVETDINGASSTTQTVTGRTASRTGLPTAGETINVKVRATTALGWGPWNTIAIKLIDRPAITSWQLKDNQLTVALNDPAGDENTAVLRTAVNGAAATSTPIALDGGTVTLPISAGDTVRFWVTKSQVATGLNLSSSTSLAYTATVLAAPVLDVRARGVQADLTWNAVSGASLYKVYYRDRGVGDWSVENATGTSLTIDLPAATTEIYVVAVQSATVQQNMSNNSNTVVVTAPILPAPANVKYSSVGNNVTVDWDAVSFANDYEVRYSVNGGTAVTRAASTNSSTFAVTAGSSITVQVRAKNRLVTGAYSPNVTFRTIATPSITSATLTDGELLAIINDPAGDETRATLFYKVGENAPVSIEFPVADRRATVQIPGAANNNVSFWVVLDQTTSTLNLTSNKSATIVRVGLDVPTVDWSMTGTNATMNWPDVTGATTYEYRTWADGATAPATGVTSTFKPRTLSLAAGTITNFEVRAIASNAKGPWSSTLQLKSLATPTNLTHDGMNSTTATVSWNAVPNAEGYKVLYRAVGTSTWTERNVSATTLSLSFVTPGEQNEVAVIATAAGGLNQSLQSAVIRVDRVPATTLTVTPNGTNANMSWTEVPGATGYALYSREVGATAWTGRGTKAAPALTHTTTMTYGNMEFMVVVVNAAGWRSPYSNIATITTNSIATPTGLKVSATGPDATVTWNSTPYAASYEVGVKIGTGAETFTTVTGTSYSFTQASGTNVVVRVRGVNTLTESPWTAGLTFQTIATPSASMARIDGDDFSITLNNVGGNATAARLYYTVNGGTLRNIALPNVTGTSVVALTGITSASQTVDAYVVLTQNDTARTLSSIDGPTYSRQALATPVLNLSTINSNNQATVTWPAVTNATGYIVYYRNVGSTGAWTARNAGAALTTAIPMPSLSVEAYVVANTSLSTSFPSPTITINQMSAPVLTASIDGQTVSLSWTASTNGPTMYRVYSREVGGATSWTLRNSPAATVRSWTGAQTWKTTEWMVLAENASGWRSAYSNIIELTQTSLDAPTGVTWTRGSTSTDPAAWWTTAPEAGPTAKAGTLSWAPVTGAGQYRVFKNGVLAATITGTSYVTPVDSADVIWTVTARTSAGALESQASAGHWLRGTSNVPTPTGTPTITWGEDGRNNTVNNRMDWSAVSCPAGYTAIYYAVAKDAAGVTYPNSQTDWGFKSLAMLVNYDPRNVTTRFDGLVRAICVDNATNYPGAAVQATAIEYPNYTPVSLPTVAPTINPSPAAKTATATVTATQNFCYAGTVTEYSFSGQRGGTTWYTLGTVTTGNSVTVPNIGLYTAIRYQMRCTYTDGGGISKAYTWGYSPSATPQIIAAPSAVTNLTLDRIYGQQAYVSWTVPANTNYFDVTYNGTTTRVTALGAGVTQRYNFKGAVRNGTFPTPVPANSASLPGIEAALDVTVTPVNSPAGTPSEETGAAASVKIDIAPSRVFASTGYSIWNDTTKAFGDNYNRTASGMNTRYGNSMVSPDGTSAAIIDSNQKLRIYRLNPTTVVMTNQWDFVPATGERSRVMLTSGTAGGYLQSMNSQGGTDWTSQTSPSWTAPIYMLVMENPSHPNPVLAGYGRSSSGSWYDVGRMANQAPQ